MVKPHKTLYNQRRILSYAIAIIMLLLTLSCSEFTAPERFTGDVFSIAGLLVAGSSTTEEHPIYITRSSSIDDFDVESLFVTDATITIKRLDTNEEWQLALHPTVPIMYVDPDPASHIIEAGVSYRIEVSVPGYDKMIWAETSVPSAAAIVPDLYNNGNGFSLTEADMNDMVFTGIDQDYPLALNTGNVSQPFNFLAELFCMEDFSTDLEFTTPILGIEHPDAAMEDAYNAGGESIRRIMIMGRFASTPQPGMPDNYLVVKDYRQAFVFYGRYRVSLQLVDDNYYKYVYMPEGYFHGGVHNALGYFGSASGGRMFGRIVK